MNHHAIDRWSRVLNNRVGALLLNIVLGLTIYSSARADQKPPEGLFIRGYADQISVMPGEEIGFHISSSEAHVDIFIERLGAAKEQVWEQRDIAASFQPIPDRASSDGCKWPESHRLKIPEQWQSGYYQATLRIAKGDKDARSTLFFIVRSGQPGSRSKILLQLATNTYNAYTNWGGHSLYAFHDRDGIQGHRVSFDRPLSSQFENWEGPFIRWAESNDIALEYAANSDLEFHPELLKNYRLVLSVGHDEYWSSPMRDHVEKFISDGGNVAFFSGNTCCWQVRSEENGRALTCWKQNLTVDPLFRSSEEHLLSTLWSHHRVGRPENSLTGVGFLWGGYHKSHGEMMDGPAAYEIHRPEHWILAGTGLKKGDRFGGKDTIVGYECDGCEMRWKEGLPYPTGHDGTPASFTIIGTCPARWAADDSYWYERFPKDRIGASVMGVYTRGGTVFTCGSTDWAHGLKGNDPAVAQITRNILQRLSTDAPTKAARAAAENGAAKGGQSSAQQPLFQVIELDEGEQAIVKHKDGTQTRVKLVDVEERRDTIRDAVRSVRVAVEIDGQPFQLASGNYELPQTVGSIQIDCPITNGYNTNGTPGSWGLLKRARLRIWQAGSPWMPADTFSYPIKQKWFATLTQMANEPTYVDGGEPASRKNIYYHSGLDIGGSEGQAEVVAASDGQVVSVGTIVLGEFKNDSPVQPRYDVVYLRDGQGWFTRYSHLASIDPSIIAGRYISRGDKIGLLGKEGGSGGWSHLHFEIKARQPSGQWGTQEAYSFLWEAYRRQYQPQLLAVARPHHLIRSGETVELDGGRSWSNNGGPLQYRWTFCNGQVAEGAKTKLRYDRPGCFSEILEVRDSRGNVSYDFAVVQVHDAQHPELTPPAIHAAYFPTLGIKPGVPVTFKVRSFGVKQPEEAWDFGDGTPKVKVHSDGNAKTHAPDGYAVTTHQFAKSGSYLVRVERTSPGHAAIGHLHVTVE